mmetsp:Transcript_59430/g.176480  ORF Transcript_59430/g.176480 Transcript_59430/m.176480 type:complete len:150 (+) Transcript_59430:1-450(+)
MLRAIDGGQLDSFFRVEDTGPCQLARLGGFESPDARARPFAVDLAAVCGGGAINSSASSGDRLVNEHNHNGALLRITDAELGSLADHTLVRRLRALSSRLGYAVPAKAGRATRDAPGKAAGSRDASKLRSTSFKSDKLWKGNNAWRATG